MSHNLTKEELEELDEAIAQGNISRSCKRIKVDWFNIKLSTGRRAVGAYEWESGSEFLRLKVREK